MIFSNTIKLTHNKWWIQLYDFLGGTFSSVAHWIKLINQYVSAKGIVPISISITCEYVNCLIDCS